MTVRNHTMSVHPSMGGLDVSSDPTTLDPGFLVTADNIEYREGGQKRKRPGFLLYSTNMFSSTPTTSTGQMVSTSASVRAIADCWQYGNSLTPTQRYVAVAGSSLFASQSNGTWSALTVSSSFGSDSNRSTNITLAGDYAVISDGSTAPVAYDMLAVTSSGLSTPSTGSNWPVFTQSQFHLNRLWLAGLSTAPSKIVYTAADNIFDSTGTDTGSFTFNRGDGDQVIGISKPFYGALYIFKGPQFGSVHQLSGATQSAFATAQVAHGAPLMNARALVTTPTDIYWLSQYGVHSLETTVKYGNVEQAFLSLPIQALWRDGTINRSQLSNTWGFWHPQRNIVGWAVAPLGSTKPTWLLCYNYALSDPRPGGKKFWSIWKLAAFSAVSGRVMLVSTFDTTNSGQPRLYLGGADGYVYEGDQDSADSKFNDNGQAIAAVVQSPTLTRFQTARGLVPETQEKGFVGIVTYFKPKASYNATVGVIVDRRSQNYTISLAGVGATL